MDHYDSKGFRSNVGIILTRDDGCLLLGGRVGQAGWQFPQGGVDEDDKRALWQKRLRAKSNTGGKDIPQMDKYVLVE